VHTLDIAPLRSESPPQKRSAMARVLKGFHSFTCTPTRSSAIGVSHTCLCLPSQPQLVLIYRPRRDGRLSRPWEGWQTSVLYNMFKISSSAQIQNKDNDEAEMMTTAFRTMLFLNISRWWHTVFGSRGNRCHATPFLGCFQSCVLSCQLHPTVITNYQHSSQWSLYYSGN